MVTSKPVQEHAVTPRAHKSIIAPIPAADFHAAIVDYAAYPQITDEVKTARVVSREGHVAVVSFTTRVMMKSVDYTLRMVEDAAGLGMSWTLVSSPSLSLNEGRWTLEPLGPSETRVTYESALGARFWIPNSLVTSLSSVVLPKVMRRFSEHARARHSERLARVA